MSSKYFIRIFVWGILILALSLATYYARILFIEPLENEIVQLEKEEQNIENNINLITTTIEKYNNLIYDNNTFKAKVPTYIDEEEIQQKYILRPINVADAKLLNLSPLSDGLPTNLKLSNDISAKKVSIMIEVEKIEDFHTFIDELTEGMRSVYIGNFSYSLPGENNGTNESIKISIEYYLFYTDES